MSFLFYPYLGGGLVVQTQIWIYPYFFCFFIEPFPKRLLHILIDFIQYFFYLSFIILLEYKLLRYTNNILTELDQNFEH